MNVLKVIVAIVMIYGLATLATDYWSAWSGEAPLSLFTTVCATWFTVVAAIQAVVWLWR